MPNLDHLKTFVTVVREASFSEAARQLGVSQPTVTNHIRTLERVLDKQLFERGSNGATATRFAQQLACSIVDPIERIEFVFDRRSSDRHLVRPVSIGGPREFVIERLLPSLSGTGVHLPPLDFRFAESRYLLDDVQAGRFDIAISTVRPRLADIVTIPVADEEFWLVAAPTLEIPTGSIARLSAVPLIAYNKDLAIVRRYWNTVFSAEPRFDAAVIMPDLTAIRAAVLAGLGMSVLPSYLVAGDVAANRLVRIHNDGEEAPINTVFLAASGSVLESSHHLDRMLRLLQARLKS